MERLIPLNGVIILLGSTKTRPKLLENRWRKTMSSTVAQSVIGKLTRIELRSLSQETDEFGLLFCLATCAGINLDSSGDILYLINTSTTGE